MLLNDIRLYRLYLCAVCIMHVYRVIDLMDYFRLTTQGSKVLLIQLRLKDVVDL